MFHRITGRMSVKFRTMPFALKIILFLMLLILIWSAYAMREENKRNPVATPFRE